MQAGKRYKRGRDKLGASDWLLALLLGICGALLFLACDAAIYGL